MEKVCILLSTYNGETYLREQLESLVAQKKVELNLIVRDDGSKDGTVDILNEYAKKINWLDMPKELSEFHCSEGIGSSFIHLLRYAVRTYPDTNYFGFADQDDVWFEDKVIRAIQKLKNFEKEKALYFSKKKIVDQDLNVIRKDSLSYHNNFCDFLSPNDAFGCTMLLTRAFAEMLLTAEVEKFPYLHDVFICKTALCTNVKIVYDEAETMYYRQHGNNVTGDRIPRLLTLVNIKKIFRKRRHYLSKLTEDILNYYYEWIPELVKEKLIMVRDYRNPINACKLLNIYYTESDRSFKEKLHFTMMIILRGI